MELTLRSLSQELYFGSHVRHYVEPLFGLFHDENLAPTLAGWMVALAGLAAAIFLFQVLRASLRLTLLVRRLEKIPGPQEFARDFPNVDKAISRVRFLRHGWNEFNETTVPDDKGATIQNTIRPSDFLNIVEAEHSGLRIRWFQPLAGVFVGVGLLLTFVGLVAALYFASQGIAGGVGADAMKRTQESLVQLLDAATFKFWTSVAGLLCSILLGFVNRFGVGWVQRGIERLCNEIERGMVTLTAEQIAQKEFEEVVQQGVQLREFNGQLAFTIGQGVEIALKSAMPQIMTAAMEPVQLQLREVTGNLGQMNETALTKITDNLGRTIQDSAGKEIRAVADTIETTRGTLGAVGERIETATSGFQEAIGGLREVADRLASRLDGSAERTTTALDQQLKTTNDTLQALADRITTSLDGVTDRLKSTTEEAGSQFSTQLNAIVDRLSSAGDDNVIALREVAEQMRNSASASSAAMGAGAEKAIEALAAAADRMAENVERMATRIEQSSDAAAGQLHRTLGETLVGIQDATSRNSALIAEAISEIAKASQAATDQVRTDGARAGEALGEQAKAAGDKADEIIAGAAGELSTALGAFQGKVEDLSRTLASVDQRVGSHVEALAGVTRETREVGTAMGGTARSLREASEPFAKSGQVVAEAARAMAMQVDKSTATLLEAKEQAQRVAEALQRMIEGAMKAWSNYDERFDTVDKALVDTIQKVMDNFRANADAVKDFVNRIDNALGEAVSQFAGNVEELQETADLLEKSTQSLEAASRNFLSSAAD